MAFVISSIGDGRYNIPALKNQVTPNVGWGSTREERGMNIFLSGLVFMLIKDQRSQLPLELDNMDLIKAKYQNVKNYPDRLTQAQMMQGWYFLGTEYTDTYIVNSQSRQRRILGNHYTVKWTVDRWTCNCPDYARRHQDCKHIFAVRQLRSQIQGLPGSFRQGLSRNDILYQAPESQDLEMSQDLLNYF